VAHRYARIEQSQHLARTDRKLTESFPVIKALLLRLLARKVLGD
jgi:hypothetical protein